MGRSGARREADALRIFVKGHLTELFPIILRVTLIMYGCGQHLSGGIEGQRGGI